VFPEKSLRRVPGLRGGQRPLTWMLVALTANTTPTGRYSLLFPKTQSSQVYLCSPTGAVSVPRALLAQVKLHNDSSRPSRYRSTPKSGGGGETVYSPTGVQWVKIGVAWRALGGFPPPTPGDVAAITAPGPVHWAFVKCGN